MHTAVIYARFSCAKQREASIEDQLRVCQEWCANHGYAVVGTYCDHAVSGRTDDRAEFQRMLGNAGESEIVLVYMMDRFSRDAYDAPIYKKKLRDKGVRVVSAMEAIPDGAEAILVEKIYEGLAAVESAHIAERTLRGMTGNALKCMHNGVRVFGYAYGEDGRYVVDEEEAKLVRECFSRRIAGESINSIANRLALMGVTTYTGRPATHTFAYNMLRNEKYTGVYTWGDVRVEGGMPAIIDKGEFMAAQAVRSKKCPANEQWGDFKLSGRAICEGCGRNLQGVSGRGRHDVKYEYYKCPKCSIKAVRRDWLESSIVDAVRSILSDRDRAITLSRAIERHVKASNPAEKVESARNRQKAAERAISNLTRAVAEGMPYEDAKAEMQRQKEIYAAAEAVVTTYQEETRFDAEDFADFLQFGATLDNASLLDAFIYQVMVGDERVLVTLNYDVDTLEPARFEIGRVLGNLQWLPSGNNARIAFVGVILIEFTRDYVVL